MGPIVERHKEVLVAADMAVVRLRERLLESVRRNEAGQDPLGLTVTDYTPVRAVADTVITQDDRWQDQAPGNMGVSQKSMEPAE